MIVTAKICPKVGKLGRTTVHQQQLYVDFELIPFSLLVIKQVT